MLNIVLIEPEIPQNTGNISRTAAATGSRLILVHPLGFSLDEKHLRRAAMDYWKSLDVVEVESSEAFFSQHRADNLVLFTARAKQNFFSLDFTSFDGDVYLVFGKESVGLPKELTAAFSKSCYRLPMISGTRSLNLSNTVAVATYEYYRQLGFPSLALTD